MIRYLRPLDIARYALLSAPEGGNRVYPLDSLGADRRARFSVGEAASASVSLYRKQVHSAVWTKGTRVIGIVAARPRSGPKSWEATHLLLKSDDEAGCAGLLERVCAGVQRRGGERLFLRLERGDHMADVATRIGFVTGAQEVLYVGARNPSLSDSSIEVREKMPADDHDLFRLYNAATPSDVRFATGMTFEQWASSRELSRGRRREFVYLREGRVRGWAGMARRFSVGRINMMMHPEDDTNFAALMDYGLALLRVNRVQCLVDEGQTLLHKLLEHRGYRAQTEYVTLVRQFAITAKSSALRRAATVMST